MDAVYIRKKCENVTPNVIQMCLDFLQIKFELPNHIFPACMHKIVPATVICLVLRLLYIYLMIFKEDCVGIGSCLIYLE